MKSFNSFSVSFIYNILFTKLRTGNVRTGTKLIIYKWRKKIQKIKYYNVQNDLQIDKQMHN